MGAVIPAFSESEWWPLMRVASPVVGSGRSGVTLGRSGLRTECDVPDKPRQLR